MTDPGEAEFASASEEDLHTKLEVVRRSPPTPVGHVATAITRTLRWQALLVVPVTGALAIAGGLVGGVRVLFGARRKR